MTAPGEDEATSAGDDRGDGAGGEVAAHLQAAALEVIAAIRALLDATEEVVRDPAAAAAAAASALARRRGPRRPGPGAGGDDSTGGVQRIPVS